MAGELNIDKWQRRLDELAREHGVPGASLAILAGGETTSLATGVLHTGTGAPVRTDSLFQIGSITKVYTTTMLMRLVERGRLDVDTPVAEILPEIGGGVTVRHLLTHTSGIDGDFFFDTGRGDDCVEKYVTACTALPRLHPVDTTVSYSNSGFVIAGRIIEVLTGQVWDDALRTMLLEPLGVTHTWTLPEDVLRFSAALGHVTDPDGTRRPAPTAMLMRSMGPCGLISASAADVLAFARLHLADERLAVMREPQVTLPHPAGMGTHIGLGWMLHDWDGRQVCGHTGGTIGQSAVLRVVPDAGVAVALLTNTDRPAWLSRPLFTELLAELCDVTVPALLQPGEPLTGTDLDLFVGVHERSGERLEITRRDGGLVLRQVTTGALAALDPPVEFPLVATAGDLLYYRRADDQPWMVLQRHTLPDGSVWLHDGARDTPRVR